MAPLQTAPGLFLGASAWSHKDWVGGFYPPKCAPKDYLTEYAKQLPSVEIDSTFYATPRISVAKGWRERTPDRFVFAAKFPQRITHEKRLIDCHSDVTEFLEVMSHLNSKLGPLLLQFPAGFSIDYFDVLARFLGQLPDGFRYAIEIRNESWRNERFFDLLRAHRIAFTLVDAPWSPPRAITTTDFAYIRWIGDRNAQMPNFADIHLDRTEDLRWWAARVVELRSVGVDIYGYFNNHYAGHSPSSLRRFVDLYQELSVANLNV